jgi:hypothetical protein
VADHPDSHAHPPPADGKTSGLKGKSSARYCRRSRQTVTESPAATTTATPLAQRETAKASGNREQAQGCARATIRSRYGGKREWLFLRQTSVSTELRANRL